ncbi:MAG TPA: hypothetical protein VJC14_03230 [Candidatus Paceibacterota bacterium]
MSKEATLEKVLKLRKIFQTGLIPIVENHEAHPEELDKGSRERYLYFTLVPALNFQRNSPNLWKSAYETWQDEKTNYVFFPEKVVVADYKTFQADLNKHKLSLQPNKHAHIWFTLCKTLHEEFESDPRKLLSNVLFDVPAAIQHLLDNKKQFPYLSGPKLSNYWLYILDYYTDVKFQNKSEISIIPDTHIIQSSIQLGLVSDTAKPEEVASAWKTILSGTELSPSQMHSALWHWSRNGFLPAI